MGRNYYKLFPFDIFLHSTSFQDLNLHGYRGEEWIKANSVRVESCYNAGAVINQRVHCDQSGAELCHNCIVNESELCRYLIVHMITLLNKYTSECAAMSV